jgi:BirA family transcriptional regulator, biotin operon repressor / biotin---[acetyl-CoA-carboxylase] ligase
MLTESTVEAAARAAGLPAGAVRFAPFTGSTNSDLVELAGEGAPGWTAVVAGHQASGRGRLGRSWESKPGQSLLVSVLLRPEMDPSHAPLLSLAGALAMSESCEAVSGVGVRCKWPNDLLAGERKVGGVLPEARVEGGRLAFVVLGAGVNVRQGREDFGVDLRDTATSVLIEGGRLEEGELLAEYLRRLQARASFDPGDPKDLLDAYADRCVTLGREVRGTTSAGAVAGQAVGLGLAGELLIRTEAGTESLAFGEVEHLR